MSVAIIGGTGFIGSAVAERLVARGLEPVVIALRTTIAAETNV